MGDIAQHMIMIMLQDFMDPWTFNQKNLMKCCKEFLLPGGKQIPFCAYNTIGYREQARAQLEAAEPERRRAHARGPQVRAESRSPSISIGRHETNPLRVVVAMSPAGQRRNSAARGSTRATSRKCCWAIPSTPVA